MKITDEQVATYRRVFTEGVRRTASTARSMDSLETDANDCIRAALEAALSVAPEIPPLTDEDLAAISRLKGPTRVDCDTLYYDDPHSPTGVTKIRLPDGSLERLRVMFAAFERFHISPKP